MIGQTLGHYSIVEKLGEGGMGEVYLAEDSKLERRVALKVLPPEMAESLERLERFEREAKAIAALNHPNIVSIHSIEAEDGVHFLTMELVEGESLGELIPGDGLPLEQFFDLAIPMADALSEAHEQGIVHRDLKPANVMVDKKGRPKILDFGLAKLRVSETAAAASELPTEVMTEEGKVLGTYPYMSPEQVEGKAVDHRSDIFSFGTMLYEMATGRRPFTGDSPVSVMSAILRETPPAVDVEQEALPHHLSRIIGRCLEKDREDRYQRARNLKKDLEDLRREVQTASRPAARPSTVAAPARGRWTLIGAAALLVLLGAAALYWARPWEAEGPIPAEATCPQITSLAVLPLENLSGDPEQEYFADGMTGALIGELSRLSALRVISRQTAMRYKDSEMTLPEIAEELDVDALVEGSVIPAGDRVRITTQLIQADPETNLWADAYDRDTADVLSLLKEVTRAIAAEIEVVLTANEQSSLEQTAEVDPDALKAYLRGEYLFGMLTPDAVMKSENYFREAIEIAPEYPAAWAGLAGYYQGLEFWLLPMSANELRADAAREGDAALAKALELDESLSSAHMLAALRAFLRDWDWQQAEREFERALQEDPNNATARVMFGGILAAMGRCDEARAQARLAERLDPESQAVLRNRGDVFFHCHDFEEALAQYEKTLEKFPGNVYALWWKGFTLIAMGRRDEAANLWRQLRSWEGNEELVRRFEGKSLEEVNRIWLETAVDPSSPMYDPFVIARVYAENEEPDRALEWLEIAFAARDEPGGTGGVFLPYLKVHPAFLYMHEDPRFEDLLRRMNLAE